MSEPNRLREHVVRTFIRDYFEDALLGVNVNVRADDRELRIALDRKGQVFSITYQLAWLASRGDEAAALLIVVNEIKYGLARLREIAP